MANVKRILDSYLAKLDAALQEKNSVTNVFEKLESKTGVKRLHIALGGFDKFHRPVYVAEKPALNIHLLNKISLYTFSMSQSPSTA